MENQCGWLKDKLFMSVPKMVGTICHDTMDPKKAPFVMQAFLKMLEFIEYSSAQNLSNRSSLLPMQRLPGLSYL
jgi:hypothetical protein